MFYTPYQLELDEFPGTRVILVPVLLVILCSVWNREGGRSTSSLVYKPSHDCKLYLVERTELSWSFLSRRKLLIRLSVVAVLVECLERAITVFELRLTVQRIVSTVDQ